MAIQKSYLKSKPECKVTFKIHKPEAKSVSVIGDFNEWDAKATPLKKLKSGDFKGAVNLDLEKSYEFKYLVDGALYENEEEADKFIFNEFAGEENGVLEIQA